MTHNRECYTSVSAAARVGCCRSDASECGRVIWFIFYSIFIGSVSGNINKIVIAA